MHGAPKLAILLAALAASPVASPAPAVAQEAPSISLKVEPSRGKVGDEFLLTVEASGSLDSLRPPATAGLPTESGPQSSSIVSVNGRTTATISRIYVVLPDRSGSFTLGPAEALSNGRVVARSNTVRIEVMPAPKLDPVDPDQLDLSAYEGRAVFLLPMLPTTARGSGGAVVVGQAFRFGVDLYVRRGVSASNLDITRALDFDGFSREDLLGDSGRRRNRRRVARVGSTLYDVYEIDRSLLIPLSAGARRLGDLEVRLVVGSGFQRVRKRIRSQPVRLMVVEPPARGRPAGFRPGAVGRFQLRGGPDRREVAVGGRILLDVVVSGQGNLDALQAPDIQLPKDFRADPVPGRDCPERSAGEGGLRGRCRFQTVLVPERAGRASLGPVRLAFYDPSKRSYEVATLGPWVVTVTEPRARGAPSAAASEEAQAEDPALDLAHPLSPPLLDRRPSGSTPGRRTPSLPAPPPPWLAYGAPIAALGFGLALRRRAERRASDPERIAGRIVARARRGLASLPTDLDATCEGVREALRRALIARHAVDPRGLTLEGLRRKLLGTGVDREDVCAVVTLLERAEAARYSGEGSPAELRTEAAKILAKMELR